jgi:hypothetical protein
MNKILSHLNLIFHIIVREVETMPFGYSNDIFKYPPVQYIPLDLYESRTSKYSNSSSKSRIYLFDIEKNNELNNRLHNLNLGNYNIKPHQLAILVLNGSINLIKYRGYEVIMIGDRKEFYNQVFIITTKYFYKNKLIFLFYNGDNEEKLDWKGFE